jgi:Helix-turn-helix domain
MGGVEWSTSIMSDDSTPEAIEPLITGPEAESILRVARGYLAKDRTAQARIPFVKIGRAVRYRQSDIRAFIAANTRASISAD